MDNLVVDIKGIQLQYKVESKSTHDLNRHKSVGTSDVMKFTLYNNRYYNQENISKVYSCEGYAVPHTVSEMTSGLSGSVVEYRELPLAITSIK